MDVRALTARESTWTLSEIEKLPLETRIGQMLIASQWDQTYDENLERMITEGKIGGMIKHGNQHGTVNEIREFNARMQNAAIKSSGFPLFLAIDQEGGRVERLLKPFTRFPGNGALGYCNQVDLTKKAAQILGEEARTVGYNFVLAPDVDIDNEPENPVIGERSYGSSPQLVAEHGAAALCGFKSANVVSCLKHFPGHGRTKQDSHATLPVVHQPRETLDKCELYPFKKLIEAPAIMSAHVRYPKLDQDNCASKSSYILQTELRNKMGFKGLVITDGLGMKGASSHDETFTDLVIKVIDAGNDVVLLTNSPPPGEEQCDFIMRLRDDLVKATQEGIISLQRVNESVQRIFNLKTTYALHTSPPDHPIGTPEHLDVAAKIAEEAITGDCLAANLSQKKVCIIAPQRLRAALEDSKFDKLGKERVTYYYNDLNPTLEDCRKSKELALGFDQIIFLSYNATHYKEQYTLLDSVSKETPTHFIATCNLKDLENGTADAQTALRSSTAISFQALLAKSYSNEVATLLP